MAADEAAAKAAEQQEPAAPEIPELIVTPFGVQVQKITTPQGDLTLLKFLLPNLIHTYKLQPDQARDIAAALTGGVHIAKANEIPK